MVFIFPICFQCGEGVNNPCKCKVLGPTMGFLGFILSAIVCWPAGAVTYCCDRKRSNQCFGEPAHINAQLTEMIPL